MALGVALLASCRSGGTSTTVRSGDKVTSSYVTEFASPARTSRVAASVKSFTALTQVAELSVTPSGTRKQARFIHLDPQGKHVLVRYAGGLEVLGTDGTPQGQGLADRGGQALALATDWGVILGDGDRRWDGSTFDGYPSYQEKSPRFVVDLPAGGTALAARFEPTRWTSVVQSIDSRVSQLEVVVRSEMLRPGDDYWRDRDYWRHAIPGRGSAAIGDDGRIVVVMDDGQMLVFSAGGDTKDHSGHPRLDVPLLGKGAGEQAYFVGTIGPSAVVFSARDVPDADMTEPYDRVSRTERDRPFKLRWSTVARWVDAKGHVAWKAEVPFEARQPPVDGADGRVYVVGQGLAALQDGAVVWSTRSSALMMATAFGDGTLAVSVGAELRIVARDGVIRQQLRTPDGEPIATPPAIAADGAVWLATKTHLYVAR